VKRAARGVTGAAPSKALVARMRQALLDWYQKSARDLPWRRTADPYAIWVAEIMLQQTRVETVLPYYARFLERFPDVRALADAPVDDVLARWSGLGYYRRARLLHQGASFVRDRHGARVPANADALREIPGVGAYTAGAIASQAFGLAEALVDGNVARVLARVFAIDDDVKRGSGQARTWELARLLVVGERPGTLNNALMELGATLCVPQKPRCDVCPIAKDCAARAQGRQSELPVASEKTKQPIVRQAAAVIAHDERFVVGRVAGDGLFGGLWEPPRFDATALPKLTEALSEALGQTPSIASKSVGTVRHVLTHRVLEVRVLVGTVDRAPRKLTPLAGYDALEMIDAQSLYERGVSTLARRVIDTAAKRRRASDHES